MNSDARFISFEPLIGAILEVDLTGIAWVIVGGESGPRARPVAEDWVRRIRDICDRDGSAFFFKQWGGPRPKSGGTTVGRRRMEWLSVADCPEADSSNFAVRASLMQPNIEYYQGREQSFLKHLFLQKYLENASYKLFQGRSPVFNFVDAFAGPWRSSDSELLSDTSFALALSTLESVRSILINLGRPGLKVRFRFCERNRDFLTKLQAFAAANPDFDIKVFPGAFEDNLAGIHRACRDVHDSFTFTFIDPTGCGRGFTSDFRFSAGIARRGPL